MAFSYSRLIVAVTLLGIPAFASAQEFALPDPGILNTTATENVRLFKVSNKVAPAYPETLQLDISDGKITGAVANYAKQTNFRDLRSAIAALYGDWTKNDEDAKGHLTIWRIDSKGFAIQLFQGKDTAPQLVLVNLRK